MDINVGISADDLTKDIGVHGSEHEDFKVLGKISELEILLSDVMFNLWLVQQVCESDGYKGLASSKQIHDRINQLFMEVMKNTVEDKDLGKLREIYGK